MAEIQPAPPNETLVRARQFLADDLDPETRAELSRLLERAERGDQVAHADLEDRFAGALQFGTAGLRGRVEAGLNRMNRSVVVRASWGLGRYLLDVGAQHGFDATKAGVVIGFDGRMSSRQFAEDTAAVLAAQGIPVHLFLDPMSTPLCAFTVEHKGACAGVMVTASHNPPADNGYKVYWCNAAQIIPPHDKGIAARIAQSPPAKDIPRLLPPDAASAGLRHMIGDDVEAAYLHGVRAAGWHRPKQAGLPVVYDATPVRIVYTAMHGVGHRTTLRALLTAGFHGVVDVPSQVDPDGTFRTVAFPNPEEKGALDRAVALAVESNAELVLANDPDADRLAVAIPDGNGGFRALSGNEVGVLLCWDALTHAPIPAGKKKLVVTSIVSSTMLSRIAHDLGAHCEEVLTGFKWIANKALELRPQGFEFVAGYEEALGYSVGPLVRDKDGVSAAVRMAELVRSLKAKGLTLWQKLDELAVAHGLSHGVQWSVTMPGVTGMQRICGIMDELRARPITMLADEVVTTTNDLSKATIPSDVLVFHTAGGARLTVRPSGTEPKIKFYLELVARVSSTTELAHAREALDVRARRIQDEVKQRLAL